MRPPNNGAWTNYDSLLCHNSGLMSLLPNFTLDGVLTVRTAYFLTSDCLNNSSRVSYICSNSGSNNILQPSLIYQKLWTFDIPPRVLFLVHFSRVFSARSRLRPPPIFSYIVGCLVPLGLGVLYVSIVSEPDISIDMFLLKL